MSLNLAISRGYIPELKGLLSIIEEKINSWKYAQTQEEKLRLESEIISTFDQYLDGEYALGRVAEFQNPNIEDMAEFYGDYAIVVKMLNSSILSLMQMFLDYYNTEQVSLHELTGQMKRIKQKQSALTLWSGDKAKYVLAEHFYNLDALDSRFTSVPEAEVDTNQGVMTLPIDKKVSIVPFTARVGSGSNGVPGNSDIDITTNNINPKYTINSNVSNWFEYERMDAGPCELSLVYEFSQAEVVNHISVEPLNFGASLPFEIEDIIFTSSKNESTSIKDLLNRSFDRDFFTVNTVSLDTSWQVTFLPVLATSITLKLKQPQAYQITTATSEGFAALRDRYAIGIKNFSCFRFEYSREGGVNTKALGIPGGLYAALPVVEAWPPSESLYNSLMEVSQDGGQTWKSVPLTRPQGNGQFSIDTAQGETALLDGEPSNFLWRLSLDRNDDAFNTVTSFSETSGTVVDAKSVLRSVSRFRSPTDISLPERPMDEKVFVIQPKVGRRGSASEGIFIGTGGGQSSSYSFPVEVVSNGIDPDEINIYVARQLYTRSEDNTLIGPRQWAFSDDFKSIIFSGALPEGSVIKAVLDEELMLFEEKSDGYYHRASFLFDPDKENISIKHLPRTSTKKSFLLPRRQRVISLGVNNVEDDSFVLNSIQGNVYNLVTRKADVFDASDFDYYLDGPNGVLYLSSAVGDDQVKVTFNHWDEVEVDSSAFDVVIEDNKPVAIRITKDNFTAETVREQVSQSLLKSMDVRSGRYQARDEFIPSQTFTKQLSRDCVTAGTLKVPTNFFSDGNLVPEEVQFVDGYTEFLGLVNMDTEATVSIEAGSNSYVTFNLSAGTLWYSEFGVVFSDGTAFANLVSTDTEAQVGSLGDYYVSDAGLVTVNVGIGGVLQDGIQISYSYVNPDFSSEGKYSVDYPSGVIYSLSRLNPFAYVEYRSACYKIAYDIAKPVGSSFYNAATNTVSVRTENLDEVNSLVKVIYTESKSSEGFKQLKNYFSPIFSIVALRFT